MKVTVTEKKPTLSRDGLATRGNEAQVFRTFFLTLHGSTYKFIFFVKEAQFFRQSKIQSGHNLVGGSNEMTISPLLLSEKQDSLRLCSQYHAQVPSHSYQISHTHEPAVMSAAPSVLTEYKKQASLPLSVSGSSRALVEVADPWADTPDTSM